MAGTQTRSIIAVKILVKLLQRLDKSPIAESGNFPVRDKVREVRSIVQIPFHARTESGKSGKFLGLEVLYGIQWNQSHERSKAKGQPFASGQV